MFGQDRRFTLGQHQFKRNKELRLSWNSVISLYVVSYFLVNSLIPADRQLRNLLLNTFWQEKKNVE
jgi:hypothetical protein